MAIDWDLVAPPTAATMPAPLRAASTGQLGTTELPALEGPKVGEVLQITRTFCSWSPTQEGEHFVHAWAGFDDIGFVADIPNPSAEELIIWRQYDIDARCDRLPRWNQTGTRGPGNPKGLLSLTPQSRAEFFAATIALARAVHGDGFLVGSRPTANDTVLADEIASLVGNRPTPSASNVRDPSVHAALVKCLLGGHEDVAVSSGQPWVDGTPAHGRKVWAVMDLPSREGASRSCAWLVYRGGSWDNGLDQNVEPENIVGWLDLAPGDTYLPYIMGPDWHPSAWSEEA